MQSHKTSEAIENLKKALEMVSLYKKPEDSMFRQLQAQEREVRKLLGNCKENFKSERKKEKLRARAMFGDLETTKADGKLESIPKPSDESITKQKDQVPGGVSAKSEENETPNGDIPSPRSKKNALKKSVSFADGTTPGSYDDDAVPSFFDEHKEALLILGSIALGSMCLRLFFRKR